MKIVLPAMTAEFDGHEQTARPGERLAFKGELARGCRLKGGINSPALADKLMQLESGLPPKKRTQNLCYSLL
ncbi:MAG: hypothetical protein WCQ21_13550, partial [Verrucomicrobiota bacterium]